MIPKLNKRQKCNFLNRMLFRQRSCNIGLIAATLILAVFFPEHSTADELLRTPVYSLRDCINLGREHSHNLAAVRQQTSAARARIGESATGFLPAVSGSAGYQHLSETDPLSITIDIPPSPQTQELAPSITNAYAFNLNIKQPVFTGFRILNNTRKATQAWQASQEDYTRTELQLETGIRKSYWQLIRAAEALKVNNESLEVVTTYLKDINSLFNQGVATTNEVLKVKAQLARTRLACMEADQGLQLARGQLALLMGLDVQTSFTVIPEPFQTLIPVASWEEILDTALKNRAEIKVFDKQIRIAELDVTQAQAGWYPSIFLNGNFTFAQPNSRIFPAREQFDFTWEVGIAAGFDIGSWFSIPFKTAQARARLAELKESSLQLRNSVTLDAMRSHLNMNKMALQLDVAGATLTQAVENRKDVSARYDTGLALKTEQLEADLDWLKAGLGLTQAKIDYELALVDLQLTTGMPTAISVNQAKN